MLASDFLQEAPNTDLSWLFYVLLGFMFVVIAVGALANRQKNGAASKSAHEAGESSAKSKATAKVRKSPLKRKTK